jgi:hypothetical protein
MRPGLPALIFGQDYVAMPFEVPKPGTPVQAFVCAFKTSTNVQGPLTVNERVARSSGFIAGNEPVAALWGCDGWPLHFYEVVVDPADLFVGRGEMLLKTSAFRVVKEVPPEEVFGPRARELGPILDEIRRVPWLAPKGPPDLGAVERLVHDIYAIVAEHQKMPPLPPGIVQDWEGACTVDQRVAGPEAKGSPAALIKAVRSAPGNQRDDDYRVDIATRTLRRILLRQSFAHAWEAGWEAAFGAMLRSSMKQNRPGDAKGAKRAWAKMRDKYEKHRDAARRAALHTAQRMLDARPEGHGVILRNPADGDPEDPLAEIRDAGALEVATDAWNFSLSAMVTAIDVLETPVAEVERSPSRPMLELFRMGLWPIGEAAGGVFALYTPTPVSERC